MAGIELKIDDEIKEQNIRNITFVYPASTKHFWWIFNLPDE